ncbi:MAG TPA: MBL fold metallo-hydrolase [Cyanobacteria bacterium UBA8803]|nr:MBL fold metallo-hydrolase [Cyanobacteria bacterium UBA9273]HBL59120.1 MBL fold metallo-hydrolase [Cyanobacteria bacterium UBA8803]
MPPQSSPSEWHPTALKPPRPVIDTIFAFPPNRDTLGGTAYLIVENATTTKQGNSEAGEIWSEPTNNSKTLNPDFGANFKLSPTSSINVLVDCPAWNESTEQFLRQLGGVSWLFITHRGGIGKAREIQEAMGCSILVQEQEAYLLPGLKVTPFQDEFTLSENLQAIWTPGHSPGSACLYYKSCGGVLFSGRHLLPNQQGNPVALKMPKTFHWPRQIHSVKALIARFTPETLRYICPGANTGFLRGKGIIEGAYQQLSQQAVTALLNEQL